jgi:protein-S-isoprenylcysteine O-methyltransferase Ste14
MALSEATTDRGPDVRFPPPLVYVAGFVVTWLLNQRMEFLIDGAGAGPPQSAIGGVFLAAGLLLMFWSILTFWRARAAVMPVRPARQLVTWGPYRFTRNPMYVGLTFGYFGLALLVNWAWPIVLLPVVLIAMNSAVIEREERYLTAAFPEAYAQYCQKTRRWL